MIRKLATFAGLISMILASWRYALTESISKALKSGKLFMDQVPSMKRREKRRSNNLKSLKIEGRQIE